MYKKLFNSWKSCIKITINQLEYRVKRNFVYKVIHKKDELIKKYIGKFISCEEKNNHINLFKDLEVIYSNKNYLFECEDEYVGIIIHNVAKIEILKHFDTKIKVTIDKKPNLIHKKSYAFKGKIVGSGI